MKVFIKQLTIFLLPILVISIPLDVYLSVQLKKSKDYAAGEYSVWNSLFDGKVNSDVVIYGSSRAWVHIDPQMIEDKLNLSAFNLGLDGHNFWLQYLRHKILIEYNPHPKTIILSVDVFSLEKRKDLFNADQFLPYMLFNNLIKHYVESYQGYSLFDSYLPIVRFHGRRDAIFQAVKNSFVSVDDLPSCDIHNSLSQKHLY